MTSVTFLPEEKTVMAQRGDTLLDVALDNGIPLEHECGGNCACTTCAVEILAGAHLLAPPEPEERDRLDTLEFSEHIENSPDTRLACQAIVKREGIVKIHRISAV